MRRTFIIAKVGVIAKTAIAAGALLAFMFVCAVPTRAQPDDPMRAKLSADRIGGIESGEYSAGDNLDFILAPDGDGFLLQFAGSPEIYLLSAERASLGGRVLKYDYGAVALRVSAWGGVTIYTQPNPGGLPATRTQDAQGPALPAVSPGALREALQDESSHLLYLRQLRIAFSLAAPGWEKADTVRMFAFGALVNIAAGLDRLSADGAARRMLAQKIAAVEIAIGDKPAIRLSGRTLRVAFAPSRDYGGVLSSQAFAGALAPLLSLPPG